MPITVVGKPLEFEVVRDGEKSGYWEIDFPLRGRAWTVRKWMLFRGYKGFLMNTFLGIFILYLCWRCM